MLQAFAIIKFLDLQSTALKHLVFEDVDSWFLEDITRTIVLNPNKRPYSPTVQYLHLTCDSPLREIPLNVHFGGLVLEAYDRAHLTTFYPFDQVSFAFSTLHLINCTGFTDSELEILSRVDPATKHPLCSTNLESLKLTGCHDFTIQALKGMVEARAMCWRDGSRVPDCENRNLNLLEVSGYDAPLSSEDRYWFRAHLKQFSWNGVFSTLLSLDRRF
jgi:hypothetical protein